jgi:hypothetical protein
MAALEPFLYVEVADPVLAWKAGISVRVLGHLIAPGGVDCTENTRSVREAIYRQAEDAIAAAEAAGYALLAYPEIRLHGPEASVELFLKVP